MDSTAGWDVETLSQHLPYLQDDIISRDWLTGDQDWRSGDRKRACAYEVWYRKWMAGWVLQFPDGRQAVEYQKRNPVHQMMLAQNMVEPVWAAYPKMRLSWWVGPFRLLDVPTPYTHHQFPYTPFFAYREDDTRVPYGVIRAMISPQQEVNARRSRMMWQLGAVRTIVEEDAVVDHKANAEEIGRPDAYIILSKNRKVNKGTPALQIDEHQGLTTQQFEIYKDAAVRVQDCGGVYSAQLGKTDAADSGVAIDSLINQGTTGLGQINSNFRRSRTNVGQQLMHMVAEDMQKTPNLRVTPDRKKFPSAKTVVFNEKQQDPVTGATTTNNDVQSLLWTVVLDDEPQTPAFKQQKMREIVEYAKGLEPQLQAIFADIVIMASDLPWKDELAKRVRAISGQQPPVDEHTSPEEMAEIQQQQEQAQAQAQLQQRAMEAEIQEKEANAELTRATTGKTRAESIKIVAEIGLQPMQPDAEEVQAAELENPEEAAQAQQVSPDQIAGAGEDALALEGQHGMPPGDDRMQLGPGT
jgi:hypothetical protein